MIYTNTRKLHTYVPGEPHYHGHWHFEDDAHHGSQHGILRGFWHSHCHVHEENVPVVPELDVSESVQANMETAGIGVWDQPECLPEIDPSEDVVGIIDTTYTVVGLEA